MGAASRYEAVVEFQTSQESARSRAGAVERLSRVIGLQHN